MKRRNFIKSFSAASLLAASLPSGILANNSIKKVEKIIKPKRLKKGDTIGLITPGSFISEKELNDSIKNLEGLGYKVVHSKNILKKNGFLSGTDEERVSDLHEMFLRNDVDAVMAVRGGYGCSRILPMISYDLIKNNPKIFIGYSDVTSLLYGIFAKTGLVCFHGPVGISSYNDFSKKYFESILEGRNNIFLINEDESDFDDNASLKQTTMVSGEAKGKLIGGNLTVAVSLIGTPYDIDTEEKIIFFEEIDEEPYRIDRMLTQLIQAGKLQKAAGIALGVFKKCEPKKKDSGITESFSLREVLFERLSKLKIPVVYGMSVGHVVNKFTLPIGIEAELNTTTKSIKLVEPAVS